MVCQLWCCGSIVRGVTLVWGVMVLAWSGVMKLLERFLYISWDGDVHYACLVVPVQCDATVDTPCPILCDFIFSWIACMRCSASSFLCYLIPKSPTTKVKVIPFLLWRRNPILIGAGSYRNGRRCSVSSMCAIIHAWTSPHIPFSNLK